jgi:geranylgeranyl diphosphate synthase type I
VDGALAEFLSDRRAELAGMDPAATVLIDELLRLLTAGGKRIRPALCLWAHRAAGGDDGPAIVRAAAALELLHTFALIHDDVMDEADRRRGVPSTHARFASEAPAGREAAAYGMSVAILVGDLAAVLSEHLLRTCGAEPESLSVALGRFDRMREEMAAGQFLDVRAGVESEASPRTASLKTSSYTAEGPVLIGAALARASAAVEGPLRVYARLVGQAFQLRDDAIDGAAGPGARRRLDDLLDRAASALDGPPLQPEGRGALLQLAELLRLAPGVS